MSEYVVNEPRRHRERSNHNDPDGHRALWNLSRRGETDAGWNARGRTSRQARQSTQWPVPAGTAVAEAGPVEAPVAAAGVENAA